MARSRREFFGTMGAGAAGLTLGMKAAEASPAGAPAASDDGPVLRIGDDIAVVGTTSRQGARLRAARNPPLPRDPVRSRHLRRQPLPAAPEAEAVDGRAARALVGELGPAEHGQPLREQVRLVPRSLELRRRERGLPADQRVHPGHGRRPQAAGAVLDPRRWLHGRQRHRAGRLRRREPGSLRRRRLLLDQPPARAARLHQPRRSGGREVRRLGQRRHARHRRGARVGARQHPELRRGSGQRHDHGAVGRWGEGVHALRDAERLGAVPQGCGAERSLHPVRRQGLLREARSLRAERGRAHPGRDLQAPGAAVEGLPGDRHEGAAEAGRGERGARRGPASRVQPGGGRQRAAAAPLLSRARAHGGASTDADLLRSQRAVAELDGRLAREHHARSDLRPRSGSGRDSVPASATRRRRSSPPTRRPSPARSRSRSGRS